MHVSLYSTYKVNYISNYSYLNEDSDFSTGKESWIKILSGDKLFEFIINLLSSSDIIDSNFSLDELVVFCFSPLSGETFNCKLHIEELD